MEALEYPIPREHPIPTKHDRLKPAPSTPASANCILRIGAEEPDDRLRETLQERVFDASHSADVAMPDLLLWDETGLRYFEDVTFCPPYYLTDEEIGILERQKYGIAARVESGSMLVELGSGNLRKTRILLDALDKLGKEVDYFALDVSFTELQRTLSAIPPGTFRHVRCFGIFGTYDNAREWLRRPGVATRSKTLLFLGSTLGGFQRDEAAAFLSSFVPESPQPGELLPSFLIGLDGCKQPQRVYDAYNDSVGVNRRFVRHGLERANEILGDDAFDPEKWDIVGCWDQARGCHNQYYIAKENLCLAGAAVPAGRRILAIQSHKYDAADRETLCRAAGLGLVDLWSSSGQYQVCYLRPLYASHGNQRV
ncbi:Pfam:DUF2260 [Aspergillus sp. HF37]|nr:Pfam:DUF2260 [Aspergillus sp. HF37]